MRVTQERPLTRDDPASGIMETCDVLFVGGGPAGSTCAWKLRRRGFEVIVLDKQLYPRDKICAGWITPQVMIELGLSADEYRRHGVIQPFNRFLTGLIGGPTVETRYDHVVSYGIRRAEFDTFLLHHSTAELRLGESLNSLHRKNDFWIANGSIQAKVVVGAGGPHCPVATQFRRVQSADETGIAQPQEHQPTILTQEIEFEMSPRQLRDCPVFRDRPELYFCPDLKGYGWVVRKENFLNIGLGRENDSDLSNRVSEFIRVLVADGRIPSDLPGHFHGHVYRLNRGFNEQPWEPNLLLVGDAAGLADTHSAEGIRPAIESGILAAETIIEARALRSDNLVSPYTDRLRQRFEVPNKSSIGDWIPSALRLSAARWLMRSSAFSRRVVLDKWFLHLGQPPLKI